MKLFNVLFFVIFSGCCHIYIATPEEKISFSLEKIEKVLYVAGDFGTPGTALRNLSSSIAKDISQNNFATSPCILSVGDNLYVRGFAKDNADISPVKRIFRIAESLGECKYKNEKIPVVVVPGNHDYDGNALVKDREWGDISIWYFLEKLKMGDLKGKESFSNWHIYPGNAEKYTSAKKLYNYLYESTGNLVDFMKPIRVEKNITGNSTALIVVDSELLIDLFHQGRDDLAHLYFEYLRAVAKKNSNTKWTIFIAHHPIQSYAKHRPGKLGSFVFGPGWPQFPYTWHKIVAMPPFGTLATLGWWGIHYRQDLHSSPYDRYRKEMYNIMKEMDVSLFIAGHDHCSQIIDLDKVFGNPSSNTIQLISGESVKTDPVTSGNGTIFYHTGNNGYAKILTFPNKLVIQMKNGKGKHLYQYVIDKK